MPGDSSFSPLYEDVAYLAERVPSPCCPLQDQEIITATKNVYGWQHDGTAMGPMGRAWEEHTPLRLRSQRALRRPGQRRHAVLGHCHEHPLVDPQLGQT
ncbi:MAG: hypothetical protein ACP5PM_01815 [Acidimicrobiales bacterium]